MRQQITWISADGDGKGNLGLLASQLSCFDKSVACQAKRKAYTCLQTITPIRFVTGLGKKELVVSLESAKGPPCTRNWT